MKQYVLSIDQGTTSSRAVIFDKKADVVGVGQKEFKQIYPESGWVEHNPIEILESQIEVIQTAIDNAGIKPNEIASVGITNQRETVVIWDKNTGKPIHNALVWQDSRTTKFCKQIREDLELSNYIRKNTGLVIDSYFSATKIKWLLDNFKGDKSTLLIGTIDTWLLWNLSDEKTHATDVSNASRTMLYNINTMSWDKRLCDFFGVGLDMLPEVKESSDDYGALTLNGVSIPINALIGDQQSALFGQACFNKGQAKNTYGTGCFMLMNTGQELKTSNNGLLTTVAWQLNGVVNYALEGSVFIAGAAIQWLRDELKIIENALQTEEMAKASKNDDIVLVPAFVGLGAPHWDDTARGLIIGITRGTNRNDFVKATLKSLAFQTKEVFDLMERESGIKLNELRVDGGASQNNYLIQFQSDILNKQVARSSNPEVTAKGAAFLAGLKSSFWTLTEIETLVADNKSFSPTMEKSEIEKHFSKWLKAVELAKGWVDKDA